MPKPSSDLAKTLTNRLRSLESTRLKIEDQVLAGNLNIRDALRAYEGLFLSVHVDFEQFIEELFIGLLVDGRGLISSRSDIVPRIKVNTHQIAREVILGSSRRRYIDWLPYQKTLDFASTYFRGGRPFSDLSENQLQLLTKCNLIRNALAHKSRYSINRFLTSVIGATPLPANERNPAGYLRGNFRLHPPQSRYEIFTSQLAVIAVVLAR